jgi:GGDEF domain-containing protein
MTGKTCAVLAFDAIFAVSNQHAPWMSFPTPIDSVMKMRLKRQGMALVSYLMFLLPLAYGASNNWIGFTPTGLALFALVAVAVNSVFLVLIRSGISSRFNDPSMTFAQIVVAIVLALIVSRNADEARPVLLLLFVACFFFGVFGLTRLQFWWLAIGTIIGYAVIVCSTLWGRPVESEGFKLEVLQFIALSMILCWMASVGGYVANLRKTLHTQKSALSRALDRLGHLVSYDELTEVFNRRHLMELLQREKDCADRFNYTFSVCILDIDHFKSINDTYGHAVGDEVLKEFSSRMRQNARKMDWLGRPTPLPENSEVAFGRYGGEEFLVIMPHTPASEAYLGVERLRTAIQSSGVATSAGDLPVLFSSGVAQYLPGESVEAMISRADKALYRAKKGGRNRTELVSDAP